MEKNFASCQIYNIANKKILLSCLNESANILLEQGFKEAILNQLASFMSNKRNHSDYRLLEGFKSFGNLKLSAYSS